MRKTITPSFEDFYKRIKEILDTARSRVYQTVNVEMVKAYWNIGREIIEEEQKGEDRAKYGTFLVQRLSEDLTAKYGKGFDQRICTI